MAISDAQYEAWLKADGKVRVVLVEAQYHDGVSQKTFYAANYPYISGPLQTPANTIYYDLVIDIPSIDTSIDANFTSGDITIHNDGSLDDYLTYAWKGWPLNIYLGDLSWDRSDFRELISGVCDAISSPDVFEIALAVKDKREALNVKVETSLLINGELEPLLIGTCFNVTPPLEDSANHRYKVSSEAITSLVVRDNGLAVSVSENAVGTFDLIAAPAGKITCDATSCFDLSVVPAGATSCSVGSNVATVAAIMEYLALRAGLTAAEIDSTNLAAFPDVAVQGLYISSDTNIVDIMTDLMESVGGYWRFNRLGKLQIFKLAIPGTPVLQLEEDDVIESGLSISEIEAPKAIVKLSFQKNWTVQDADALAGAVAEDARDLYGREYGTVTSANAAIKAQYPLAEDTEVIETYYSTEAGAQAECDRQAVLRSVKRFVYRISVFTAVLGISLGDTITVTNRRFGFAGGKDLVVIGLSEWVISNRVDIEAWG